MPLVRNSLDASKSLELILYIAERLPRGKASFHTISKILYFSDLCHLERYGSLITNDSYVAMRHGPVPSAVYDIMKKNPFRGMDKISEGQFDLEDNYCVVPRRSADTNFLSESELECLDQSLQEYGRLTFRELSDRSHQGAWEKADENDSIRLEDMIGMLPNADELKQHIFGD